MEQKRVLTWGLLSLYRAELMGIAIVGILFCHYSENFVKHGLEPDFAGSLLGYGTRFVDVFFFLSGIGLYYSLKKCFAWADFYKKRLWRILPAYFIIAVPGWLVSDIFASGGGRFLFLKDLFFVTFFTDGTSRYWFVFAILVFYAAAPFIFLILDTEKERQAAVRVLLLLAGMICGSVLFCRCFPEIYENIDLMIGRVPIFLLGIFCGRKCRQNKKPWRFLIVPLLASLPAGMLLQHLLPSAEQYLRRLTGSCFGLLLTFILVKILSATGDGGAPGKIKSFLRRLGDRTLEIYLSHSMLKALFGYPYTVPGYLLVCVLAPILLGTAVRKVTSFTGLRRR